MLLRESLQVRYRDDCANFAQRRLGRRPEPAVSAPRCCRAFNCGAPAETQLPNEKEARSFRQMAAFRRDIGNRIQPHIEEFAQILGLAHASPELEDDVIEAIQHCILATFELLRPKRYGAVRKDLSTSAAAQAAEKSLRRLRTAYERLSAPYQNTLARLLNFLENLALALPPPSKPLSSMLCRPSPARQSYTLRH